jgi:hypothetical protein
MLPAPAVATEFEVEVKRLHLTPEMYAHSFELRRWCLRNKNRCYISEQLLKKWDMVVEIGYGSDAI